MLFSIINNFILAFQANILVFLISALKKRLIRMTTGVKIGIQLKKAIKSQKIFWKKIQ
jgi:hypothetical protein